MGSWGNASQSNQLSSEASSSPSSTAMEALCLHAFLMRLCSQIFTPHAQCRRSSGAGAGICLHPRTACNCTSGAGAGRGLVLLYCA